MDEQNNINNSRTMRPFYKRWYFWVLILIAAILIAGVIMSVIGKGQDKFAILQQTNDANPQFSDKPIVANPVDLSTIEGISKFRSCMGHEFGYTSGFSEEKEVKSSMKHYFTWKNELTGENSVPVFAPFDGTIIHAETGTDQFIIQQDPFAGWVFDFTHVIIKEGLKEGSAVKAGELVGHANVKKTHAIDLILQTQEKPGYSHYDWYNNYESIFDHMSDDVYAQFAAKGATKENIIISKSVRDASPCSCDLNNPPIEKSPYCNFSPVPFGDDNIGIALK